MEALVRQAEAGRLPDALVRVGIRRLIRERLRQEGGGGATRVAARQRQALARLSRGPIAEHTEAANAQHYDTPAGFLQEVLGPRMKYSACLWPDASTTLAVAEERMLELYLQRAGLRDGMQVLDLGCGWGSFALWLAGQHPNSRIVAVSNSAAQRRFVAARALAEGLGNVEARTADVNEFAPKERFDRIVSVEMFEHMRNFTELMRRISSWLAADGALFVHIFCHRDLAYPFETDGGGDWMARHFFTGGIMPARDTLEHFSRHMKLEETWEVAGTHYQRTARAWLDNLDRHRAAALTALTAAEERDAHAPQEPLPSTTLLAPAQADLEPSRTSPGLRRARSDRLPVRLQRWRMFFMACEELFGFNGGDEWLVCHYRFRPRSAAAPSTH